MRVAIDVVSDCKVTAGFLDKDFSVKMMDIIIIIIIIIISLKMPE
jgi:MFS-type transporter involved in bile tolerance (Atg22 family)